MGLPPIRRPWHEEHIYYLSKGWWFDLRLFPFFLLMYPWAKYWTWSCTWWIHQREGVCLDRGKSTCMNMCQWTNEALWVLRLEKRCKSNSPIASYIIFISHFYWVYCFCLLPSNVEHVQNKNTNRNTGFTWSALSKLWNIQWALSFHSESSILWKNQAANK